MSNIYEQRFFSALKDTFIGHPIKGKSGYVNLMDLKAQYFAEIEPYIKKEIEKKIEAKYREELFEKLFNFFDCYLNETGTVFFANSQIHKNLYEKVYSDRDDVALFWKTQKLYYVKSEANYDDLQTEVNEINIKFDASEIKHAKGNEKKSIQFFMVKVTKDEVVFKIRYQEQNKYDRLKTYLDIDKNNEIIDLLLENYGKQIHPNISFEQTEMDFDVFTRKTDQRKNIYFEEQDDVLQSVKVEYSINDLSLMLQYLHKNGIILYEEDLKKIFSIYKRQNEIDYFIHKDAEGFLKEQFGIYVYNWLFNDLDTDFDVATVKRMQNIKKITHKVIEYIARFEDELKAIWEKPKFVRNCNYVVTLDRFAEHTDIIEKLLKSPGWEKQVEEWVQFKFIQNSDGIDTDSMINSFLPIDTKYFKELQPTILEMYDNLDETIDGVLVKTDNWQGLKTLENKFKDQIDLIYIDPPFNTGSDFSYKDKYQDSTWLTLMENRLTISSSYLKDSGNFFLHLDRNAQHLGKLLLDNTLGSENFVNEIIWRMGWVSGYKTQVDAFVRNHDTLFFYCKNSKNSFFNKKDSKIPYKTLNYNDFENEINEIIKKANLNFDDIRSLNLNIIKSNKEVIRLFPSNKNYKEGNYHIEDTWNCNVYEVIDSNKIKRNVAEYTPNGSEITQKPEELLERIISLSTPESGFVVDYFSGSGTTIAVAHKLKRKWLGMEINKYFESDVLWRAKNVLFGKEVGISKLVDSNKGGFFKYYELEQYEDVLAKAQYQWHGKESENQIEQYSFLQDQKLLEAIEIDYEKKNAKVVFEKLYPDVDIAETLSNLSGKHIKQIFEDKVVFEDGSEVIYDEMTFEKYPWIKPLIWWNSKNSVGR